MNRPALGIDLGTTNSAASCVDATGTLRSIVNFEGDPLTPSAILIDEQARLLVGREAVKLSGQAPDRFVESFKRRLGEANSTVTLAGQSFRPEFLSAALLLRLKLDFERTLGEARSAVITVPAYFDDSRRRATRQAGEIAGWTVTDIINEPTAAALAFAHRHQTLTKRGEGIQRILVYDLGGGTFDCTVLEVSPGHEYRTLATDGEVRLGGLDWDQRLADHLAELFQKSTGLRLDGAPSPHPTLLRQARQLKHTLSTRKSADAPVALGGARALLQVSRETFAALTRDLLERTRHTVRLVLDAARLRWSELDHILLVGGSSRMPMVAEMLEAETGRACQIDAEADVAIAHGAALYAHLLANRNPIRVVNVNAHALRIVGRHQDRKVAAVVISRNTPLPAEKTRIYPLTRPDQSSFVIDLCEGDSQDPEHCEPIGRLRVSDLPPASGSPHRVAVTLRLRADGNVEVAAAVADPGRDQEILKSVSAMLIPTRGLRPEQIAEEHHRLSRFQVM